ncbi:MAG: GntR family transcriptional regulator [bacterium]
MNLAPRSERRSQFDKALIGLRSLVMDGAFNQSVRLSEVALAERLGISRTPLRQAMEQLVAEGLLERIETGGCRVASFTFADIFDAIELRGMGEGLAARLAAERGISPAQRTKVDAVLAGLDEVLAEGADFDMDAYVTLNARFHEMLWQMPASAIVERELRRICSLPLASPSAFLERQGRSPGFRASLARSQWQHRSIIAAIAAREGTRAEALAREHARTARDNLTDLARKQPRLAEALSSFSPTHQT